jgi:hypothetical protein
VGIDASATIAALTVLSGRFEADAKQVTEMALEQVRNLGALWAPAGIPGNSTNAPGDLKRSIDISPIVRIREGEYTGRVGPTVIYGRQRELGGHIYPRRARVLHFWKFGQEVYTHHVYQPPHPYMKPGRAAALPIIRARTDVIITATILSTGR